MNKDITIVITSYKSRDLLLSQINLYRNFKTIIIENSNDLNFERKISNLNNIIFLKNNKNLGFAKANNLSIPYIKTKFVLILNPDIVFEELTLVRLLKKFSIYNNLGCAVPSLYDENGLRQNNSKLNYIKTIIHRNSFHNKIKKILENKFCTGDFCADYAIGCFMLFKTDTFKKLGGFSEDFFIFYEDNDICDRLRINNLVTMEFPDCKVYHKKNSSANYSTLDKYNMAFHHKVSEYIYLRKNIKNKSLFFIIFVNFLDYVQRFFFGIFLFKKKKIKQNFIRLCSIMYFIIFK